MRFFQIVYEIDSGIDNFDILDGKPWPNIEVQAHS